VTGLLDVLACGMVTAVGLDAPSSCAAMRARLDGFRETQFMSGPDEPLVGAQVPAYLDRIGDARLACLAAGAILECLKAADAAPASGLHVILCLAESGRPGSPSVDGVRLLGRIAGLIDSPSSASSRIIAEGRPGGHAALRTAARLLSEGEASAVLIVGVDNYLTAGSITHFLAVNRLLTPDNANGFIPGEAAAAILCVRPGQGHLALMGLGLAREAAFVQNGLDEDGIDLPLRGDGMTSAYKAALGQAGIEMRQIGYRISDLIGENYFFKQAALASIRLVRGAHGFQDIWSPGESLGNVGAAVSPLMIAMSMTAAEKGYSAGNPVLIEASGDSGACGAAVFASRKN
jgi:3-oxoacyl-[acyl-carrier-protein] synthase I